MYATHTTRSARFLQTSSCPDGLRQSCMPHTPHAVHVSFRPVLVQMDWGNHVCHTHHTQCTFPSDQFVSRWTEAIMYATHTTRSARFLQTSSCPDGLGQSCMPHTPHAVHVSTSSCPDGLRQSCMPHTPHAVHVSFRPVRVQMDWGNHVCHTHHTQCTFPSDQFVSRWTEAIMYATHTTRSARFLQTSSCPDGLRQSCMPHTPHAVHVSFRPVRVQMD